jgi:hypothetical protein
MSKFGWDLPPGCRLSDIPGNRPEDIAYEKTVERIEDALKPLEPEELHIENIVRLINEAFEQGYQQAVSDADEARAMKDAP